MISIETPKDETFFLEALNIHDWTETKKSRNFNPKQIPADGWNKSSSKVNSRLFN